MGQDRHDIPRFSIWLDVMRGLAALVVFIGHARVVLLGSIAVATGIAAVPQSGGAAANGGVVTRAAEVTSFGHEAVIVFFVMSGFLVGGGAVRAWRAGRWSAENYAIARLSRLWTVLLPVLVMTFVLDHLGYAMAGPHSIYMGPAGQEMVFPDQGSRMGLGTLFGNVFFVQKILTTPYGTNSPLWSLSYEFWFYVAFPFLMLLVVPGSSARARALCLAALAAIGLFVGQPIVIYFGFWLVGVAVELAPRRMPQRVALPVAAAGSVAFVVLLAVLYKARLPLMVSDAIETAACGLLCHAIVNLRDEVPRGRFAALAGGLAAMSYTLYLVHAPVIAFVANLLMPQWHPWPVGAAGLARFGATCVAVFVFAMAMYRVFERNTPVVRAAMTRGWAALVQRRIRA